LQLSTAVSSCNCDELLTTYPLPAHGAACIYAASTNPSDKYDELASQVNKDYPNTKIIGYPFGLQEQDTLTLIDDVLNAWGRYVFHSHIIPIQAYAIHHTPY